MVQGAVSNAGAFDFRPGLTVVDVLKQAEPNKLAAADSVRIVRMNADGNVQIIKADYLAMSTGKTAATVLLPGHTVSRSIC